MGGIAAASSRERARASVGRGAALDREFDLVFATSLMNAAEFMAVTRSTLPLVVYFHENQLSYPRPADEPLDHGLALAALSSAAAADTVIFNSRFHRDAFLDGLKSWTARFPEFAPKRTAAAIRRTSRVMYPGIDWQSLSRFAEARPDTQGMSDIAARARGLSARSSSRDDADDPIASRPRKGATRADSGKRHSTMGSPLILWNHRWEFDKNPGAFFAALDTLAARGRAFRVALLGENTQFVPKPFLEGRARLGPRVVRFGYVPSRAAYERWLGAADIVVSTTHHENFGLSVAEAIAAGAFPLLPSRLSYPELLPARFHGTCLYRSQSDLVARLDRLLGHPDQIREGRSARSRAMRRYDWSLVAADLDAALEASIR